MNLPVWITDSSRDRINFHEPFELQYWLNEWGISESQIRKAKAKAGSSIVNHIYCELQAFGLIRDYYPRDPGTFENGDTMQDA